MSYKEVAQRLSRDPKIIFDRLYWQVRGIRVMPLKEAHENDEGTLSALASLSRMQTGKFKRSVLKQVVGEIANDADTAELGTLFTRYGSDKATKHNYYLLYGFLLKGKRNLPLNILEIGLGTNNTDTASNMGKDGRPGASLRAFKEWAPHAKVYGADIDTRVLFSEERIETYYVDQTKPETLEELAARFPKCSLDLFIDDGLHNTWANINTLNAALDLIKPDGYFVVEDILDRYLPAWETVAALLTKEYDCQFIRCKTESVFTVSKKPRG